MRAPDDAPENNRREFPIIIIINTSRQLTRTSRTLTNIYPSIHDDNKSHRRQRHFDRNLKITRQLLKCLHKII